MGQKILICHTAMYDGELKVLTKEKKYPIIRITDDGYVIKNDKENTHFFTKRKDEEGSSFKDWFKLA
jgi:hypothetical protein